MFIKSQLFSHNKHVFFSVAFNTRNGRGALLLHAQFPVPRACIHEIPVHDIHYHIMDGARSCYPHGFPSPARVYTKSPSITSMIAKWTGRAPVTRMVSRPPRAYTRNPRPRHLLSQNGREMPPAITCFPVHLSCIHEIPVQ